MRHFKSAKMVLVWAIVAVLALSLVACGGSKNEGTQTGGSSSTQTEQKSSKPAKITVAGVVFQEDQFMKLLQKGYQDAAKAAGVECLVSNTNNDQAKETELINTYVAQKVSGLAIAPLSADASVATLKKADEQGMKIAVSNINLNNAPFIVGGYTSDNKELGRRTGQEAVKFIQEKLGGKAKIAILQFKSLLPEQSGDRTSGFLEEVKKLPGVEIVADQDAWLQDKAVQVAGDIITAHPDVNIIWAANEGGTIGATMAVQNAGKAGKIFTFGTDASEQLVAMLKDPANILQAVTGQDPYTMGYKTMETLIKAIKGEDVSSTKGKCITVPGVVLSRSNPDGIAKFEADLKAKMGK
ncbi:Periplasmic binding protein-like I [Moorella glycerini]|uniref:ABC transporter periplasmic-binding protein YphF n=1 Tax=Neomoorella stamsii TaxID=1266720 RepID=A0A9X7J2T0_9FIRM|nr:MULTISPECIES: substrate-binding domain-containing protein [Moorella]PRR72599.1 ABC transporter periplasmic-binding protein YphF precursor [Moorella stamsii]CEP67755.1 Periplasmic binding protein-like I [Moorella glycerini]